MGNSRRGKSISFDEWKEIFLDELKRDRSAFNALNRVAHSEAERGVVLELLFHHLNGDYWAPDGHRNWNAFKTEANGLIKRGLALASEIEQLGAQKIFCISFPTRGAFLAREGNVFLWRRMMEARSNVLFDGAASALRTVCDCIDEIVGEGDRVWSLRDFGNLNLVLLSIFLKCTTGRWQDSAMASLVGIAHGAGGKKWQSQDNPIAAIAELRRRFRVPDPQLEWLDYAVYPLNPVLRMPNNDPEPKFLKRYGDRDSLECAYARALRRRQIYNELYTTVQNFVREMRAGRTIEVNDSLVAYMNSRNVAEVNRWLDFNIFVSKKQRRTRLPDQHKHRIDHRKTAA